MRMRKGMKTTRMMLTKDTRKKKKMEKRMMKMKTKTKKTTRIRFRLSVENLFRWRLKVGMERETAGKRKRRGITMTKKTTPQRRVAVKRKWMTATAISCNGFISSLAYSITFRWTCAMMPNMKRGREETRSSLIFWITSSLSSPLSSASASLWPEMRLQMRQTRSSPKVTFVLRRDFWPVPRAIVISSCARSENKSPMIG